MPDLMKILEELETAIPKFKALAEGSYEEGAEEGEMDEMGEMDMFAEEDEEGAPPKKKKSPFGDDEEDYEDEEDDEESFNPFA